MKSAAATSRFVWPSATSSAIRRSASVSSSRDGARPPIRASSARAFSAQSGAPSRSNAASASAKRRACRAALLRPPLRGAEREQRTRVLERILGPRVLGQRRSERDLGAVEIAPRGEQERAATGRDRERPGAVEQARALLPGSQLPLGLLELADRDQRLQRVGELQAMARLEQLDAVADLPGAFEVHERGRGIAAARAR